MDRLKVLKSERTQIRRFFTKALKEFDDCYTNETNDIRVLRTSLNKLQDKADRMFKLDEEIKNLMFADETTQEEDLNAEFDSAEDYRDKWLSSQGKVDILLNQNIGLTHVSSSHSPSETGELAKPQRHFNLPKLHLTEFDGNVKSWIAFWGQFKKVHHDLDLPNEDKFQYLIQATKPGSSAREMVESFPPAGDNYSKAIEQLKSRFARDEFLIEVYVRELLSLVMQQATGSLRVPLCKLYDRLETQLRALETLGVTSEKYAAMLYPLVESSLPEDTLRAWERFRTSHRSNIGLLVNNPESSDSSSSVNNLQDLLNFLRTEVESEERLALARSSFTYTTTEDSSKGGRQPTKLSKVKTNEPQPKIPTAATILTTEKHKTVSDCLFCSKSGHTIQDCAGFHKLNLNEKNDFILKKGACFTCLRLGHITKNCKMFVNCFMCHKKHFAVMCKGTNQTKPAKKESVGLDRSKLENSENSKSEVLTSHSSETLLQTLLVTVVSKSGKEYLARVLLDSGSQRSYITKDCVAKLGLNDVGEEVLNHSLFGGVSMKQTVHKTYLITLKNVNSAFKMTVPVLDQDIICNYVPRLQDNTCLSTLRKKGIVFTDVGKDVPDIKVLLGADVIGELFTGNVENVTKGLVAVETYLGWTIMGKQQCSNKTQHSSLLSLFCSGKFELPDLWSLDTIGIKDPMEVKSRSHMEEETFRHFEENVKTNIDGRYEVCLPWIEGHPKLLDNRDLAEKRLLSVTKRLHRINKFSDYDNVFNEWLTDGVIEKVPETVQSTKGHYLPHHAVVKDTSMTTKIRPVFDASAKDHNGVCLNSCLEKGPNLVELIPTLLMKFRHHKIGVTADIRKAFLQIGLASADRDYLKFLWWDDYKQRSVHVFRHCRVVFGVKSSPFLLGATISHHLDEQTPPEMKDTAEKLKSSFYVDNVVTSVSSVDELNCFVRESSMLMSTAKFQLRDWCSNIPISAGSSEDMYSGEPVVPLLGMLWDTQEDMLFCDTSSLSITLEKVTKRSLLSIAQRIFDIVGFTSPVTLIPKLLLQEAWTLKLNWDEELPNSIACKFFKWSKELQCLENCRVQRTMSKLKLDLSEMSIHIFCDASKYAYAACIFIRSCYEDKVDVQLVSAKSRIAPMKPITIPRLELLAAVIGTRLYTKAKESLNLNAKAYFWTDSTTVLTWINVKENWSTFVGNRCKEICQATDKSDWYHVPGDMNAADLPSRGCGARALYESKWWEGPTWLKEDKDKWPATISETPDKEAFVEKKKTVVSAIVTEETNHLVNSLLRTSKYSKLLRILAWIIRFVQNSSPTLKSVQGELSLCEINGAESKLLKCVQIESFYNKNNCVLKNIPTFIDNSGLLRVRTRLTMRDDSEDFKTPILLPTNHPIVALLIMEKHVVHQHAGVQILLTILRENFWIVRGRKTVRNVLTKCTICNRYKAKAGTASFPPLPLERVSDCNAFHTTGIDLAGPLYLSSRKKAWVVLFTCSVYRAVHLELIESMSTEAFITALRRFIARRGRISIIFTDNGTNFVGTSNLLNKLDWKLIREKFDICNIVWKFNPPSAPWWGGWWERLVRMVKELLRRNLGSASLSYEELSTVLCDCESNINSRPLTYLSDDFDMLQPLTPSMFLQPIIKSDVCDLDKIDSVCLNKRVRYIQRLRESLRSRFRKEYLSMLVQRVKGKQFSSNIIKVGDVVLIGDDNTKRINWPLALVLEMYEGKDGISRVARLRTSNGELTRPIQRLYPLEVREDVLIQNQTECTEQDIYNDKPEDVQNTKTSSPRLTRRGRSVKPLKRLDL